MLFECYLISNQSVETKKQHVVKKIDLNAFATTHYHMAEGTVEREVESNEVSLLVSLCSMVSCFLAMYCNVDVFTST